MKLLNQNISSTIVVVNQYVEVIRSVGDSYRKIFARSSPKLFQVLPAIEAGIIGEFQLTDSIFHYFAHFIMVKNFIRKLF